jgi:hypothetical protein
MPLAREELNPLASSAETQEALQFLEILPLFIFHRKRLIPHIRLPLLRTLILK